MLFHFVSLFHIWSICSICFRVCRHRASLRQRESDPDTSPTISSTRASILGGKCPSGYVGCCTRRQASQATSLLQFVACRLAISLVRDLVASPCLPSQSHRSPFFSHFHGRSSARVRIHGCVRRFSLDPSYRLRGCVARGAWREVGWVRRAFLHRQHKTL